MMHFWNSIRSLFNWIIHPMAGVKRLRKRFRILCKMDVVAGSVSIMPLCLGEFDGYPLWNWFSDFMGGIRWKNYIATFSIARVSVEDAAHPCMKGIPGNFIIEREEWYTYDKSPRPNVRVLASVDEATYQPNSQIKMGDHPD